MLTVKALIESLAGIVAEKYTPRRGLAEYLGRDLGNFDILEPITTLMLNGQSNMVAPPPVPYGQSPLTRYLGPDLLGFSQTSQTFVQLVDGGANAKSTLGPGGGQIGTILARRLATEYGVIRVYALAYSGQGIDYFLPTSLTKAFFEDNTQHATLNNYALLKSYVTTTGVVPQLYVWIQGEADAGVDQATYYGKLKTLFDQTRIDYPGIKWLIVGTIGNAQDRSQAQFSATVGNPLGGVRGAQRQLADENPDVVLIEEPTDMLGATAYFDGVHYTAAGYEEIGERLFVDLRGTTPRADVKLVEHSLQISGWTWTEFFLGPRSVASGDVQQWQTLVPPSTTIMVPNVAAPGHVAFDDDFGGRGAIDFALDSGETLKVTGLTAANNWTVFCVAKLDAINNGNRYLFSVNSAGGGTRIAFIVVGQANKHQYLEGGSGFDFVNTLGFGATTVGAHSYCMTIDTTNTTLKLYVDGVLFGTATLTGAQTNMTEVWVGSHLGAGTIDGRVAHLAYARNAVATAEQVAKFHAWAKAEFKLVV